MSSKRKENIHASASMRVRERGERFMRCCDRKHFNLVTWTYGLLLSGTKYNTVYSHSTCPGGATLISKAGDKHRAAGLVDWLPWYVEPTCKSF
jgi:hypothetical protein